MRVDPNQLPSGTGVYFLVIAVSSFMVAFWAGQFLPGLDYFTTPFVSPMQPGLYSVANGFYGLVVLFGASLVFSAIFPRRQRRAFGPVDEIGPNHSARMKIQSLAETMGVRVEHFLADRDITNADAISFGLFGGRTLLLGKRLLLMSAKAPSAFMARIAHELGHFKNGDVKYVVMSRALLNANIFLMAVVLLWMCIVPARVVLMQYYLFTAPAFGLPGASPELFFKLHGWRWAMFWFDRSLGGLMLTAPVFFFWAALLFLEYRSLLRTRELLADAQSATTAGEPNLLSTLTGGRKVDPPSFRARLYELLSPHPLVSERISVAIRPEDALRPGLLRFLFLGYLWSLTTWLDSNIDIAIAILNASYGNARDNQDVVTTVVAVMRFENTPVSLLYLSMFAVVCTSYFLIVITYLRSCISERLKGTNTLRWCAIAVAQTLCMGAGAIIGTAVHPYSQASQASLSSDVMLGKALSGLMFHPVGMSNVVQQLAPCAIFFATACLFWIATGWILNGKRKRKVRAFEWILFALSTFMSVYQSYAVIWMGWQFPNIRSPAYYASGFVSSAVLLTLALVMIVIIRGGFAANQERTHRPRWLLAGVEQEAASQR